MVKRFLLTLSVVFLCSSLWGQIRALPKPDTSIKHIVNIYSTYYDVGYDTLHKMPIWVQYMLTPDMAANKDTDLPRKSHYRKHPALAANEQATDDDFYKSGYDRGHLCPAEDMDFNASAMLECFYYTNIAAQAPGFNRGWWKRLENQVRRWAQQDTIWVITGGMLFTDGNTIIGDGNVYVPDIFYKVVLNKDMTRSISFFSMNIPAKEHIEVGVIRLELLEQLINIDFVPEWPVSSCTLGEFKP